MEEKHTLFVQTLVGGANEAFPLLSISTRNQRGNALYYSTEQQNPPCETCLLGPEILLDIILQNINLNLITFIRSTRRANWHEELLDRNITVIPGLVTDNENSLCGHGCNKAVYTHVDERPKPRAYRVQMAEKLLSTAAVRWILQMSYSSLNNRRQFHRLLLSPF